MSEFVAVLLAAGSELEAEVPRSVGKWVFVAAFALLLVWLVLLPRRLVGQVHYIPPWWRNVRFWAIMICFIQMMIYICFA